MRRRNESSWVCEHIATIIIDAIQPTYLVAGYLAAPCIICGIGDEKLITDDMDKPAIARVLR